MRLTPAWPRFTHSLADAVPQLVRPATVDPAPSPHVVALNRNLAAALGLPLDGLPETACAALLSGTALPEGAVPMAQAYAGHQFGRFVPRLGDGRALFLGDVTVPDGSLRELGFKGSGPTLFSRGGDGKAALGPMLREHLLSEAMAALGISTTRALAVVATGETVYREAGPLPGAVLARIAQSHLRVGHVEYLAAMQDTSSLGALVRYTRARHPSALPRAADLRDEAVLLLDEVVSRQAALVADWMAVGFIHGVMNTDNMSLSGETLDYGPSAFLEHYAPEACFSSIDTAGRYAFGRQPAVAQWNLARLGEALLSLDDDPGIQQQLAARVESFGARFHEAFRARMAAKLGLSPLHPDTPALMRDWLGLLERQRVDYTAAHRALAGAALGQPAALHHLVQAHEPLGDWLVRWRQCLPSEPQACGVVAAHLLRVNPLYIPRNHRVEHALERAQRGDLEPYLALLDALTHPYDERQEHAAEALPAPTGYTDRYRTFCGT